MAVYLPRVVRERAELGGPVALPRPRDGRRDDPARRGRGRRARRGAPHPGRAGVHRARGVRRRRGARARRGPRRRDRPARDGRRDAAEDRAPGRGGAPGAAARAQGAVRVRARGRGDHAARAGRRGHRLRPEAVHARPPGGRRARAPRPRDANRLGGQLARILIVDDEPGVREALRRLVANEGHLATVTGDTTEARAELRLGVVRGHPLRREPARRVRAGARPRGRRGPHRRRRPDGQRRRRPGARRDRARARRVRLHRQAVPRQRGQHRDRQRAAAPPPGDREQGAPRAARAARRRADGRARPVARGDDPPPGARRRSSATTRPGSTSSASAATAS